MENSHDPIDPNERWLELENMFPEPEEVPHSGSSSIPENVRERPPEENEFDNTPLEQPANDGILDAPDSPATLPEHMPSIDNGEAELTTTEKHSTPWRNKLGTKIAAGALAGVALLGVRFMFSGDDGEVAQEETGNQEVNSEVVLPENKDDEGDMNAEEEEDSINTEAGAEESEFLSEEYMPVLMSGPTPSDVIDQYKTNMDCVYNAPILSQQHDCVRYIVGDDRNGDLSTSLRQAAIDMDIYRRNENPDYVSEASYEILDSSVPADEEMRESQYELLFILKMEDSAVEEPNYQRFRFIRSEAVTITEDYTLESDIESELIWILQSRENVEPGTTLEIR